MGGAVYNKCGSLSFYLRFTSLQKHVLVRVGRISLVKKHSQLFQIWSFGKGWRVRSLPSPPRWKLRIAQKNAFILMVNSLFQMQRGKISAQETAELCGVCLGVVTLEDSPITNTYCILHYFFWESLRILKNAVPQLWYECDLYRRRLFFP